MMKPEIRVPRTGEEIPPRRAAQQIMPTRMHAVDAALEHALELGLEGRDVRAGGEEVRDVLVGRFARGGRVDVPDYALGVVAQA